MSQTQSKFLTKRNSVGLSFCIAIVACLLLLGICRNANAEEAKPFCDGDRVCFIGDSITHIGSYHTQIALFYLTRYPQMKLEVNNYGISGDTAAGAVRRYSWDIAPAKATVATVMLGMNDVGRGLYSSGKEGPDIEKRKANAIESNRSNMEKLAELLTQDGVRIIFITPSLFDQTGNQEGDKSVGVNDALKCCGDADRILAKKFNAGLVDFNGPMEKINLAEQQKNPDFTLIGRDRVHPGAVGNMVMAYLFLKSQSVSPVVSAIHINADTTAITRQENCTVSSVTKQDNGLTFDCIENALPFPISSAAQKAMGLVPLLDELNQEVLTIDGLADGEFKLLIDGTEVFQGSATAFAHGVNLALLQQTPQYQQALKVETSLKKRESVVMKLRTIAHCYHLWLWNIEDHSPEAEKIVLNKKLDELNKKGDGFAKYCINLINKYLEYQPQQDTIAAEADALYTQACNDRQPVVHHYTVIKK